MDMDMMIVLQAYLPQIIGALFVCNALYFFGQNDKLEKNNLVFASLGFLILVFQGLFNILMFLFSDYEKIARVPLEVTSMTNVAFTSLAALCMGVGAFEYAHILAWVKRGIAILSCLIIWVAAVFAAAGDGDLQIFLPSVYLTLGLGVLGAFFCFSRFTSNAYNLRSPGLIIVVLAFYYFQSSLPFGNSSATVESVIYLLIVWGIYRTTMFQLKKEARELADELKETKAKIPMIIQASPFPIIISALKDDRLLLVNEKASALFNIDTNNMKQFRTEQYYVDSNTRKELLQKLSISPIVENFHALLRKPNTDETFLLEISARVIDYDNEVALYSAFKDITAQKKHEQDLFAKAVLDPLTGCYNRRQFQELAMKEIRQAWRYDTQFCLIMMDIDHFKQVNDTHGHAFGDEVLKALARTCKQTLRDSDIFARFGGEEFICLLTQTKIEGGALVAERLRENIEKCGVPLPSGEMFHFSASIGIVASGASDNLEELIKRADAALYTAKENGRNQVRVYGEAENYEEVKNQALNEETSDNISDKIIAQATETAEKRKNEE